MQSLKLFFAGLIVTILLSSHTILHNGNEYPKPVVKIQSEKPEVCLMKGLFLKKGLVKSASASANVEVLVFLQQENGHWMKKYYNRRGSGTIPMNLGNCSFTGNYHALAYYASQKEGQILSYKEVLHLHNSKGDTPKFRITRKEKYDEGIKFIQGEVFTPKGETVEVTIYMEKKEGGWRKKHFKFFGSGMIDLDVQGKDLTGRYKSSIQVI
ncbi:MAG: hypothetical protein KTR26_10685 [Flammeovirgaceae bacterium]|nr:hypothetical protein [Flammeovirgaceae bacterium]